MEVAGQWRREWAGTAEYGKVVEGGVTRRVARAMEVVNASGPGAQVRVVRAAYHETAGRGTPAASYLMHSSQTVMSSGFNLLESPKYERNRPLEISSVPLESSPEPITDTENYKVTEPDDFEISEPSKWRSSASGNSLRMPSEESSSTDNASIIDLDARHRNNLRKYSYDSENSDLPTYRKNSSRASPLLDTPVTLSTLKYKSLLNGNSSDWNNRRKSYSFEDTSPLTETITHKNDTLAMESSTDSGICKSTEIVNDSDDKYLNKTDRNYDKHEGTFKDWLSKNRQSSPFYKGSPSKHYRGHDVVIEEPTENTIALQSKGKVSITVPITVADDYEYKKSHSDDADRRIKKVEFCKTELHFTAETGKVNIIATDEKPPPSNDFRKRRSAFVPIRGSFDKPITLFGDITKEFPEINGIETLNISSDNIESDENTAATKSILKNKIPKPKPYLLGENMAFGSSNDSINKSEYDTPVPAGVSLINRQLHTERRNQEISSFSTQNSTVASKAFRIINSSPKIDDSLKYKKPSLGTDEVKELNSVKNKLKILQSPVERKAKTRQLRDSDLTYFGFGDSNKSKEFNTNLASKSRSASSSIDDLFHSVSLVRRVSNSVCNSEAESEDTPEYQNLPIKSNFAPVPTPRTRSKFDNNLTDDDKPKDVRILKPVIEDRSESNDYSREVRRSRARRQEETTHMNRSISEPPKKFGSCERPRRDDHRSRRDDQSRSNKNSSSETSSSGRRVLTVKKNPNIDIIEETEPAYVNLNAKAITVEDYSGFRRIGSLNKKTDKITSRPDKYTEIKTPVASKSHKNYEDREKVKKIVSTIEKTHRTNSDSIEKKPVKKVRTEKLATPDYPDDKFSSVRSYDKSSSSRPRRTQKETNVIGDTNMNGNPSKSEHRSRSSQRHSSKIKPEYTIPKELSNIYESKDTKPHKDNLENVDVKYQTRNTSKDKKSTGRESSNSRKHNNKEVNANDSYKKSGSSRTKELNTSERQKNDDQKSSQRDKYVINYSDKNGTVSSVCKLKPGSSSSRKKKVLKETNDIPKERSKSRTTEKTALLQLPDQWDPYEMNYADKKWKRKMHVQRTCQLL